MYTQIQEILLLWILTKELNIGKLFEKIGRKALETKLTIKQYAFMEVSICQSAASYASTWAVFGRFFLTLLYTLFGLKILMF